MPSGSRERLAEALARIALEGRLPAGPRLLPADAAARAGARGGRSGALLGVVTRNRMGCEVLCTDLLFAADVDAWAGGRQRTAASRPVRRRRSPRPWACAAARASAASSAASPVRGAGSHPDDTARTKAPGARPALAAARTGDISVAESLACEPVWEFARRHPDLGVRVYRTAAGLRVPVTGAAAPPASDRARALLTELGSDPLYVELCSTHDSYRARLTPKPFRIGQRALAVPWPFARRRGKGGCRGVGVRVRRGRGGHAVCRLDQCVGARAGAGRAAASSLCTTPRCRVGERLPLA